MERKDMVLLAGIKAVETFLNSVKEQLFGPNKKDTIDVEVEEKGVKDDSPKNTNS